MNKLTALKTLANAYWYVRDVYGNDEAAGILHYKFNRERRMLMLEDLKPASVVNEGLNGPMPRFF